MSPVQPTSGWIVQQLRDALPLLCRYQYIFFDRDAKFGSEVFEFLKASDISRLRRWIEARTRAISSLGLKSLVP